MTTKEALYKLLRIAIGNEDDLSLPEDVNLAEIMELSEMVGINGLAVSGFQKMVDSGFDLISATKEDKQRRMTWIGLAMMMEQKSKLQWRSAQQLVDLYAENGITTVGLKGITVAQWYPNPMLRDSCDFDCFLLKKETDGKMGSAYEEGNKVVEAQGVHVDRNIYVHSVFEYKELVVENHHYLSAIKLGKRQRRLDAFLRKLLIEEPLQTVGESKLMMGSPMFNAVFLTHHAHRHLLNEYMPMKLLCDWALFIGKNASLDWERFWQYADDFGMLRFAQSMTRLACELLGARVSFMLSSDAAADALLENSIWDLPDGQQAQGSMFVRRFKLMNSILHSRERYRVFYDASSFAMVIAYIKGHLFGGED